MGSIESTDVVPGEMVVTQIVRAEVVDVAVNVEELARQVGDRGAGAVVTFSGVVRNHDGGRGVSGIAYSAHPSAGDIIVQIAHDIAARPGLRSLAVAHRVGDLDIGDVALGAAISADHRREAFEAVSALVDLIKERLPIWKHQRFTDGSAQWSNCP